VKLTDQQQSVVDAEGNFLLLACPGSGKTRSAAERVARLSSVAGTKVAVCSYTNVGADRLNGVLRDDLGVILGPADFVGTLHGFLIQYVLAPFGHLFGGEAHPVVRAGDDWEWPDVAVRKEDPKQRVRLDQFRRAPDGTLVLPRVPRGVSGTPSQVVELVGDRVLAYKKSLFLKHGLLTGDDAMWAVLQLLNIRRDIALSVATRFDELLLDEAQDTSELQLECLKALHQTGGLGSLVLIGDLEQSIYSFQGASAARCRDVAAACGLELRSLTENHRSSQRICDVAAHFRGDKTPDTAVGPDKDCAIQPELVVYPQGSPEATMEMFRARLSSHGISTEAAVVLARRNAVTAQLNGATVPADLRPRHVIVGHLAAAAHGGTLSRHSVRAAERLVADSAWGVPLDELDDSQRAGVRSAAQRLLLGLPAVAGDLREFILNMRGALAEAVTPLVSKPVSTAGQLLPAGPKLAKYDASALFTPPASELTARTVHSFKGEDSEAVMVVMRPFHHSDPTSQMDLFQAVVAGEAVAPDKEEERRVMFVALTRARRYCLVAVPDDRHGLAVASDCADLGFDIIAG
jgi:superfamily I DNA/RNA helicase